MEKNKNLSGQTKFDKVTQMPLFSVLTKAGVSYGKIFKEMENYGKNYIGSTIGEKVLEACVSFIDSFNTQTREEMEAPIKRLYGALAKIQMLMIICHESRLVSVKREAEFCELIRNAKRQTIGWMKANKISIENIEE